MSAANITNGLIELTSTGTSIKGQLIFTIGSLLKPGIGYTLNRMGTTYSLSINPLMTTLTSSGVFTANLQTFTIPDITKQIPIITSDGTTTTNTIGIFSSTNSVITIYASIDGANFNIDTVNNQGWQNTIMINFSL